MSEGDFLSRWSRRKLASKATSTAGPERPTADVVPAGPAPAIAKPGAGTRLPAGEDPSPQPPAPLPPVETLTPESDFAPFMKAEVDPATRRQALKALFQDPRFNVMDGLDVYIDDYSKPDPLPQGWLEKMNQFAHLGDRAQRDADEAAAAAAAAEKVEIPAEKQTVVEAAPAAPSDTPDAISQPSEWKES